MRRFPKFVAFCLGFLLVGLGVFYWWCQLPVNDPATLAAIRSEAQKLIEERARVPADQNGYESLKHIWGTVEDPKDEARRNRLVALKKLFEAREDYQYRLETAERLKGTPELAEAEKQTLEEYPALKAALEKPAFVYPTKLRIHDLFPDFLATRQCAQTLAALGAVRWAQGQPEAALEPLVLGLKLGTRLAPGGGLTPLAVGVADFRIVDGTLFQILNRSQLPAPVARKLEADLKALEFGPPTFLLAMDTELVIGLRALERLAGREDGLELKTVPVLGPLFFRREQSAYANWYLKRRPDIEKLALLEHPEPKVEHPWDPAVDSLAPHYLRTEAHFKYALARLGALKAMAALQAEKAEKGSYPETLSDLPPGLEYKRDGQDYRLSYSGDELTMVGEKAPLVLHPEPSPAPGAK